MVCNVLQQRRQVNPKKRVASVWQIPESKKAKDSHIRGDTNEVGELDCKQY